MYLKELCGFVCIILPSEYNLKKRWHKLYHAKRDWNKFESLQCSNTHITLPDDCPNVEDSSCYLNVCCLFTIHFPSSLKVDVG